MRYHDITTDDMKNGSGLRVVLWVSGCEHKCPGCHNPVTWDINDGLLFDDAAKSELFSELEKSYISGVTFSGGDPLHTQNRKEVGELICEIKEKFPKKTIWLYTGYNYDNIWTLDFMDKIDVLVDGRYDEELRDTKLHWRGSANQRVIDIKKTISEGKIVLYCG
ncbi:MAG: anaerobic ribonucleoside-triphosphate reductase activating protein [Ruminococcaceae bacterium]|nr:anaerobic ribonucleoside-triphosphate reductase activating protein [Oscillospiraceae bacterium]